MISGWCFGISVIEMPKIIGRNVCESIETIGENV